MKKGILLLALVVSISGFAQTVLPVQYRIEKQSMSTPMSEMEDIFFGSQYYTKPINVLFNGSQLHMYFDCKTTFVKESVTQVASNADFDDDESLIHRTFYTMDSNPSDTVMFVIDTEIPYVQVVLPTKNSKGEKIGYTSYKKYVTADELALN